VFGRAEQTAAKSGSNVVGVVYLFDALLQDAELAALLRPHCRDFAALQSAVALYARRPLQPYPAVAQKASTSASMMGDVKPDRKAAGD
jgi:hypothetical protein